MFVSFRIFISTCDAFNTFYMLSVCCRFNLFCINSVRFFSNYTYFSLMLIIVLFASIEPFYFLPSPLPSSLPFSSCPHARLRPRGWGLHPHLLGGLPSSPGEGSTRGEGRRAGISLGQQDQAHQSLCHHSGQAATDWICNRQFCFHKYTVHVQMLRVNPHIKHRKRFAWSACSFWFANCFDFVNNNHICKKM